jgi:hypothetical protein
MKLELLDLQTEDLTTRPQKRSLTLKKNMKLNRMHTIIFVLNFISMFCILLRVLLRRRHFCWRLTLLGVSWCLYIHATWQMGDMRTSKNAFRISAQFSQQYTFPVTINLCLKINKFHVRWVAGRLYSAGLECDLVPTAYWNVQAYSDVSLSRMLC